MNRLFVRSDLNQVPVVGSDRLTALARRHAGAPRIPELLQARSYARLRQRIADAAGERYCESNRRTAELTGLPLERYGWMLLIAKPARGEIGSPAGVLFRGPELEDG